MSQGATENLHQQTANVHAPLHEALVGESPFIHEVNDLVARLADSTLTVLITGETGTGKDVVARMLHRRSSRNTKPFVKVNCPALPHDLLESELFGYEKGAFTGARTPKPGRFELADRGTIFLDEIGEISQAVQAKLIQALDGEPFMRLGGTKPIHSNARIIAATNVSIEAAVAEGRLRRDISFRLSEFVIHMKPLRERPEDISALVEHFNHNHSQRLGREIQSVSDETIADMQSQHWRGNIRELSGRVKEFVATGSEQTLLQERGGTPPPPPNDAPEKSRQVLPNLSAPPLDEEPTERQFISLKEASRRAVEKTERALIEEALRYTLWNRRKAAKLLSISYSSLLRRIDAYEIGKS